MGKLVRFGVALEESILKRFDRMNSDRKYGSRSEAIRDLMRAEFVRNEWQTQRGEVVCVITIVYDHHHPGVVNRLLKIQHDQPSEILCSQHVHLDHDHCLEVILARGKAADLEGFSDQLKALKGVKFSALTHASTGSTLA